MSELDSNSVSRSDCKPYRDEETLRHYYQERDLSSREVADQLGVSKGTILRWLRRNDIERNAGPARTGPWTDEDKLREEYWEKGRSLSEIADAWDSSTCTIYRWMQNHGIPFDENAHSGENHWNWKGEDRGPGPRDCPECGETHTPDDNRVEYCSRECAAKSLQERVSVECSTCGDEFEVTKSRSGTAKYCSMECSRVREEIECEECGETFEVRPSRSHKRFCSRDCYQKWHTGENHHNKKEPVIEECAACGETLELPPWKADRSEHSFCDEDCRADWRSEWASGRFTGEDHWMYEIDPEDHPMYNGGDYSYGPGWNEDKKQAVRGRDGYKCAICGTTSEEHYDEYGFALNVHHIVPAREFDDPEPRNDMDNLVTLCRPCHSEYEGLPLDVNT